MGPLTSKTSPLPFSHTGERARQRPKHLADFATTASPAAARGAPAAWQAGTKGRRAAAPRRRISTAERQRRHRAGRSAAQHAADNAANRERQQVRRANATTVERERERAANRERQRVRRANGTRAK